MCQLKQRKARAKVVTVRYPRAARDPIFDAYAETEVKPSTNLERDELTMWNTVSNRKGTFDVAPISAINASCRVFETLKTQLIGKDINQIRELIGFRERTNYGYHNSFYSLDRHAYVYRFDCGSFGRQYNLYLDDDLKVTDLECIWIE